MAQKAEVTGREEQIVVFKLAEQTYGVDIGAVAEIIRMESITRVPRAPEFVEGVINLRGRIIPVIDLRKRFGLPEGEQTRQSRIIIVEIGGMTIGMIVDAVLEVLRIPAETIEPPPAVVDGVDVAYLRGIALWEERMIILLNLQKILYENEREALEEAEAAFEATA
ncbi:purine-binding chemotaxis protein CheW [Thermodesulfitimonas autotrophica]|uniref:Chemotaxis protein CheW n=1 Tax=Thermodesulfitimonas autotrophica TaxID=1894989 RepID=A0A3N5BB13_9THEO|nr:chemotaxis protein CheW [Thermodesulfitimonas autotrophica]RPF42885.1 purine-binding chemotaxis protein CheW [Thermodesulfitimonas autotrophica]